MILEIPLLITGTLLIESFFENARSWRAHLPIDQNADFPVIKAITVITAILYMIFQLLSDLMLRWLIRR